MSEYIVDTFGIVQDFANLHGDMNTPLYHAIMDVMVSRQHEQIVRCRDCAKWATEKRFTGGCCGAKGDADPGGYCAWGERRDT